MRDRTYQPNIRRNKYEITQEEIDTIRENARDASELLKNNYLMRYCEQAKKDILELHAKQAVYDVSETTEKNGVKRTMHYPSRKEYEMLAGEYRFIERLLGNLEQTILICEEMEKKLKGEELDVKEEE